MLALAAWVSQAPEESSDDGVGGVETGREIGYCYAYFYRWPITSSSYMH
jgi:hypothetical protein